MSSPLPGMLLRSPGSPFGDRVFYVETGRRHWVHDGAWLLENGFSWHDDVYDVLPGVLENFLDGGDVSALVEETPALPKPSPPSPRPAPALPGLLLRSLQSQFGERVFYVENGKRQWVYDGDWLNENGFSLADDLLDVLPQVLESFLDGGDILNSVEEESALPVAESPPRPTPSLPGVLLRSLDSEFGERVFYVENGKRQWVHDGSWLLENGFVWPDDVRDVDAAVLENFVDGGDFSPPVAGSDSKADISPPPVRPAPMLPGLLMRSLDSEFGERVFYVENGKRHWVRDGEWMTRHGFVFPDDVVDVTPNQLIHLANGSPAPVRVAADLDVLGKNLGSLDLREIAAASLRGIGIEFGPGASPFPVPLECHPLYADMYSYQALRSHLYPGQTAHQVVRPDFVTDLQTLSGIADESLDFVVACHVIEHTVSPITAFAACHRALRPGGSMVLVVPDFEKTFDRSRELTPLQHFIDDHVAPSRERDHGHFLEFYTRVFPPSDPADIPALAEKKHAEDFSIHYHCWNHDSFADMVAWINRDGAWSSVWSHPTLPGPENIEFYFVLTK